MQTVDKVTVFLAELIGTGMLLFFGCAGCITWGGPANHFQIVINFGLAVMAAVQIFGCISGAHLNPSVTVAALIFKKVDFTTACIYVTAQLLGSFMGFGLLKVLTPDNVFGSVTIVNGTEIETENALCLTMPHSSLSALQAVVLEFVATSVLILTCCACAWDSRNANHHDSLSLRFGLTIASIAYSVGPYTGASLNPARSLAPALWHGNMQHQWIYWVGPLLAGIIIAAIYRMVFLREPQRTDKRLDYSLTTIRET